MDTSLCQRLSATLTSLEAAAAIARPAWSELPRFITEFDDLLTLFDGFLVELTDLGFDFEASVQVQQLVDANLLLLEQKAAELPQVAQPIPFPYDHDCGPAAAQREALVELDHPQLHELLLACSRIQGTQVQPGDEATLATIPDWGAEVCDGEHEADVRQQPETESDGELISRLYRCRDRRGVLASCVESRRGGRYGTGLSRARHGDPCAEGRCSTDDRHA